MPVAGVNSPSANFLMWLRLCSPILGVFVARSMVYYLRAEVWASRQGLLSVSRWRRFDWLVSYLLGYWLSLFFTHPRSRFVHLSTSGVLLFPGGGSIIKLRG